MQPYVIFNTAMSLDGRVGKRDEQIVFSNKLDNYRVHTLRGSVDAVMVGVETVISDDPNLGMSEVVNDPYRVIIDGKGEIPSDSRVLDDPARVIVVVSKGASKAIIRKLEDKGVDVLIIGEHVVNLKELLWALYRRGIKKTLLEGGGSLSRRMFNEGFVDEAYITVAPILIGEGVDLFQGQLDQHIKLTLEGILQYGDQVVLHYLVKKS
ncbi:MAG: dihydrofolate reductase family protein [Candidatus Altiarchaeota archaeon]|nr:dihydrofolate reductase family protein [Candidatus Altiarchaeota archaeon]